MFKLLDEILKNAPEWTELRFHKRVATSVLAEKGELRSAKVDTFGGVGVRVLVDGAWGFSSTSDVTESAINKAVEEAAAIAKFMSDAKKEKVILASATPAVGEFLVQTEDPVTAHDIKEKIELVRKTEERLRAASELVASASASYGEYIDEKYIVSTEGVRCHVLDSKPELRVRAVASKDGKLCPGFKAIGVTGGWSDLFTKGSPEELADAAVKLAVDSLDAPYAEGGTFTVVLDPEMVGLLCHEAIGHTVEADFVLSGSAVKDKIGKQVGSELVTLVDSGLSDIEPLAAGTVLVDDEGTPGKKTVVIENGILKSYLHNRETAALFNVEPTGNARAWEYNDDPLIRMRNTYLAPGEGSVEEMLSGIEDGYYLKGAGGGQADANAEFMFGATEAYRVKDGKVGGLVREATISGDAFEVLKSIDAVGSDFRWAMGSGYCGKGQPAKVDGGGPSVRCRVTVGGKQEG